MYLLHTCVTVANKAIFSLFHGICKSTGQGLRSLILDTIENADIGLFYSDDYNNGQRPTDVKACALHSRIIR